MLAEDAQIVDRAIDWYLRQADMTEADWVDFVGWLAADPAHARAFDSVALDLSALAQMPELYPAQAAPAPSVREPARAPRRVWAWAGGGVAIAAAASLTLMVAPLATSKTAPYTIETKPGQRQDIALIDGTRIELNGATRLLLDHADARTATLEQGQATFHVRHDARDPFTVHSGGLVVQDVGTVFDVERDGPRLDVQVAEGSVVFQPRRDAVTLTAGGAVSVRQDLGTLSVGKVDVAKVGGWRSGAVAFTGEPLARVLTELKRIDGADVALAPSLSQQPFTGMVRLSGEAARDVPHLAALVGAKWRHDGERWSISPR